MRIAIAIVLSFGAFWAAASPAGAALVPLAGAAAWAISENTGLLVETAAKRTHKAATRSTRKCG